MTNSSPHNGDFFKNVCGAHAFVYLPFPLNSVRTLRMTPSRKIFNLHILSSTVLGCANHSKTKFMLICVLFLVYNINGSTKCLVKFFFALPHEDFGTFYGSINELSRVFSSLSQATDTDHNSLTKPLFH